MEPVLLFSFKNRRVFCNTSFVIRIVVCLNLVLPCAKYQLYSLLELEIIVNPLFHSLHARVGLINFFLFKFIK